MQAYPYRRSGYDDRRSTIQRHAIMIGALFKDCRPLKFLPLIAIMFAIMGLALGFPIAAKYYATGLVPRFPTAIPAAAFMLLCSLSLAPV